MDSLHELLLAEHDKVLQQIDVLEKRIKAAPKGTLHVVKYKGKSWFKRYNSERKKTTYLPKSNIIMIKGLAQKMHDVACLKFAKQRLKAINRFLKTDSESSYLEIYENLPDEFKNFTAPLAKSMEYKINEWVSKGYAKMRPVENGFKTLKGDTVRSKSEKLISDLLYMLGVPYRYEMRLDMGDGTIVYPDFTIYDVRNNRLVYYEHFGMMDDLHYVNNAIRKHNEYLKHGLGNDLIITFESSQKPLDLEAVEAQVKKYALAKSATN